MQNFFHFENCVPAVGNIHALITVVGLGLHSTRPLHRMRAKCTSHAKSRIASWGPLERALRTMPCSVQADCSALWENLGLISQYPALNKSDALLDTDRTSIAG